MKKRALWSLLLVVALLAIATPAALAYGTVVGQVNDGYGNPWTHGGTVTCTRGAAAGTIATNGAWTVTLSSNGAGTCSIDPGAGSLGDPAAVTCSVPSGGGAGGTYTCATVTLPNGPNAVSLSSFSGSRAAPAWLLAPVGLAAAVFFWVRGR